ncbi:copine-9 [Frankliniella occidentalis]|uniref:Copine-9 n=1 Tax=Frankliniella occidentalis TaxID=133901 RepID=A0A6J1STH5_FRAOC|nr:copine-9 [Frankliniella occidentalis]XP_052119740.1 copine-9 [Frankliniella occidentalis]
MWTPVILGLIAATYSVHGGRANNDPLTVGDTVRIRVLVEKDSYFGVVACGSLQCRGVRLEGVDKSGMGFRTFVSDIADVESAERENKILREKWVIKQVLSSATSFVPGRQYTFVVSRPTEREMIFWVEGKESRVARIGLEEGKAMLRVAFHNGQYSFIDDDNANSPPKQLCPAASLDNPLDSAELDGKDADILEVFVGCRYKSEDKINAMCIVYLAVEGDKMIREAYRSKLSRDTYDRKDTATMKLPFRFQDQQILIMKVYHGDTICGRLESDKMIGTVQTPLATINRKGKVELSVTNDLGEEFFVNFQLNCEEKITFSLSGKNIPVDHDVSLKVMRAPSGNTGQKFYRNNFVEVVETPKVSMDTSFVHWGNITISVKELCDGDYDRPIKFVALAHDDGDSKLIGSFEATLNQLKQPNGPFVLVDTIKQAEEGQAYTNSGQIFVGEIPLSPTFSQYVAVGFEIVGSIQIDFTASNNDPTPSLHYISDVPNNYEVAILSVGEVVEKFVSDSIFKVYGFGSKLPGESAESFDFSLNLGSDSPDCKGVQGVLKSYHDAVPRLSMSGPTHLAPGLRKIVNVARNYKDGSKYLVHLLLTDGDIHDPQETKEAILEASSLPLSIIMVGIGNSDFSLLKRVTDHSDGDTVSSPKQWTDGNGRQHRDIVQFVAMKDFVSDNRNATKRALRNRVLSKIPPQYLEYMKIRKIAPKPPKGSTITREC